MSVYKTVVYRKVSKSTNLNEEEEEVNNILYIYLNHTQHSKIIILCRQVRY